MMQITHAPSGAAIGKFIPNPFLAFLAGVGIHLVIDKIPHWWPKDKKKQALIIAVDYLLTLVFIFTLAHQNLFTTGMIWGMIGSLAVDIVLVGLPPVYKSKIGKWHTNRQPHYENPFVFATDLVVILIACLIIFS